MSKHSARKLLLIGFACALAAAVIYPEFVKEIIFAFIILVGMAKVGRGEQNTLQDYRAVRKLELALFSVVGVILVTFTIWVLFFQNISVIE